MDKKEIQKLKKLLEENKSNLEEELQAIAKKGSNTKGDWDSSFPNFDDEDNNPDTEDKADEVEEYINRLPVERALEIELKNTNEALERIENGTYGKCTNCGKSIPEKRLKAMPEARLCIECANKEK
ncbi:MAG: TraR/DksA C4-type zinc finger protein [Candidatus Spechtbacterales bacterium]|nr:TraR/DksA C4-type zinc finger protein [Candidatus Spechtbacterales bacterium]